MADENVRATDFEEGARRAVEWLGRSDDAAELAQIIGEIPATLGDMEIAFLIAIGRAKALAGHEAAPQSEAEAKARPATLPPPPEAPAVWTRRRCIPPAPARAPARCEARTISDQQRQCFR